MTCAGGVMLTGCDDALVVIGGFGTMQVPIDSVEKFDPKAQEWVTLPVRAALYFIQLAVGILHVASFKHVSQ